jgi:hypothetical protein
VFFKNPQTLRLLPHLQPALLQERWRWTRQVIFFQKKKEKYVLLLAGDA